MMGSFYERLARFLSEYAKRASDDGPIPPDPVYIRDAIGVLIDEGVFTRDELRRAALEQYDVIIPDSFFLEV